MSTTPYARLLVSLNGGAAAAGGIEAAASDDVDFVYESTIGWPSSPAPYLEIYEAPLSWAPVPSTGWIATDGGGWKYYGTTPPPTIAALDAAHFGKVAAQLVVGGGLKDGVLSSDMTSGATVLVRSASVGLESVAWRESTEFDSIRAWIGAVQRDLRLLETSLAAVGALTEAQLRAVSATLTAALPVNAQKITGLANGSASTDAAAFGQLATAINAAVSGTTNTLPKIASANVLGDSGITDDGTTVNTTRVVTCTKSGISTTKTAAIYSINATASGSQVSAQIGGSAKHSGGTQHNFGYQCEPQSAARSIWRLCYGTGDPVSTPPSNTGFTLDTIDPNYGVCLSCSAFQSTGTTGFRMSVGGGGVKENGGTGQVNFYGASTSIGTLFECALAVGDADTCWEFNASAGTRTAGNFVTIRDGGSTVFAISSATATRGRVSINGLPIGWNAVTINANATVAIGDKVLVQGGAITVTLPAVPSVVSTRDVDILIVEVNGGVLGTPITVAAGAGDLINGAASVIIGVANGAMSIHHDGDGTNWRVVGGYLL